MIKESIYDKFMKKAIARTKAVKQDNPLKMETMIGAQASLEQMEKIKSYLDLGKKEGAKVLTGGSVAKLYNSKYKMKNIKYLDCLGNLQALLTRYINENSTPNVKSIVSINTYGLLSKVFNRIPNSNIEEVTIKYL